MTSESSSPLRIAWLVPDDRGGGVVSVAQGCCRQAVREGHDATLLLLLPTTGRAGEFGGFKVQSLEAESPYSDAPKKLVDWLRANPQDILMVNGCEQADVAIPQVPSGTRVVYVVHDTADRYFSAALQNESCIDAIVAVSETVAARFRRRLKSPDKLRVIHNGTVFPIALTDVLAAPRNDNLVFLGGDNPAKGAYDVLVLWPLLQGAGFVGELHWFGHLNQGFRERIGRGAAIDRIALRGKQSRSSIFETAVRSKAVLMLSRGEPFGMATVECMGMGCLSVAWDVASGTKEIVGDGEGFFAPLGDFQALTSRRVVVPGISSVAHSFGLRANSRKLQ